MLQRVVDLLGDRAVLARIANEGPKHGTNCTPSSHGRVRSRAEPFRRSYARPANDVRIDCKAAKHSDGDRGAPLADIADRTAGGVPPSARGLL